MDQDNLVIHPEAHQGELTKRLADLVLSAPFISDYAKDVILRNKERLPVYYLEKLIKRIEQAYAVMNELLINFQQEKEKIAFEIVDTEHRLGHTLPIPTEEDEEKSLNRILAQLEHFNTKTHEHS
jgi:hypothetical protein